MNTDLRPQAGSPLLYGDVTEKILSAAFKVLNTLGTGLLEKVHEKALSLELMKNGCKVENQKLFHLAYEGIIVGDCLADIVVDGKVIVECKAVSLLDAVHEAQIMNYLKASGVRVGLLINFGRTKLQYKRFVV